MGCCLVAGNVGDIVVDSVVDKRASGQWNEWGAVGMEVDNSVLDIIHVVIF
jgi:hypothetical protein